ncbi:MAG: hypothetical protein AABY33_03015 [Pseudomonadota bacterium]
MVDLRLITILPPQPVQGVQQPQVTGNQSGQVTVATLPVGSVLSGFIINRDSSGNPVLRTEKGDIIFSSNFFLKIGSEITIRIEQSAGSNTAHILSVNGQDPEIAVQQSGFTPEPEVIVSENLRKPAPTITNPTNAGATTVTSAQSSSPTITITGTIISPVTTQADAKTSGINQNSFAPANTILPNGSQLSLKIVDISKPAPIISPVTNSSGQQTQSLTPSPTSPPTQQPNTSNPISTPYATYAKNSATIPYPSGNTGALPTQQPPSQTSAPLPTNLTSAPQTGQQIVATVISNDPNGEAIVQTPLGIIRLQAGTQLPIGSHVTFEIAQIQTPEELAYTNNQQLVTSNYTTPAPLTQLARTPGALSNIFTLISGLQTNDALNFINNNIPTITRPPFGQNPNESTGQNNILTSLFRFAATLKSGDFREWLGRGNTKWLEDNGHENLLKKAEGEFMSLARQFVDVPPRSWQSLFFPIAIAGELQQTRLFVKRDRKQKENNGNVTSEENTRFVLEMDLSQLGEMQMDGFVRNHSNNVQFDLIIRSLTKFSQEIENDILNIYNNIGELTGYKGSLSFQTVKEFTVNPMEEIIKDNHENVII